MVQSGSFDGSREGLLSCVCGVVLLLVYWYFIMAAASFCPGV